MKSISVPFQTTEGDLFRGDIPIRFFIGLNGSGKSVFLEAICRIVPEAGHPELKL